MAYKFRKEKDYKYLWVKNGKIYLKKNDDDQALQIKHENFMASIQFTRLARYYDSIFDLPGGQLVTSGSSTPIDCAFKNIDLFSQLAIFHGYVGDHRHQILYVDSPQRSRPEEPSDSCSVYDCLPGET
ncbi:hypothetical protein HHI36_022352 [Cryptolaemus montrouzieri]|uniref:FP protein C-terminal domain-containing protein n=1 Tax=Cryptolaemus montrouzieri TaxID=559131 RepID=A0ABD2N0B9_9CUCU